jgi:hypothetical protein
MEASRDRDANLEADIGAAATERRAVADILGMPSH